MIRVAVQILTYFYVGLGIGLSISTFVDMKQVVVGYGQMAPFTSPTNNMALIHIGPTSPVELNLLAGGPDEVVTFKDENMNHGKSLVADTGKQERPRALVCEALLSARACVQVVR